MRLLLRLLLLLRVPRSNPMAPKPSASGSAPSSAIDGLHQIYQDIVALKLAPDADQGVVQFVDVMANGVLQFITQHRVQQAQQATQQAQQAANGTAQVPPQAQQAAALNSPGQAGMPPGGGGPGQSGPPSPAPPGGGPSPMGQGNQIGPGGGAGSSGYGGVVTDPDELNRMLSQGAAAGSGG